MNAGDHYGPYRIIRLIGRGAMGEVFLAEEAEANRQLALKVVYKGPEPEDQDIIEAERLGAELQKRLSGVDPRVVQVNRYGDFSGDLFIDLEYIDGDDLSTLIARGPLDIRFAAHVARELCEMLGNLGAFTTTIGEERFSGVIHGDLKPRNIRINGQNYVKVLDFGIAKALTHTRKYTVNVFASAAYCSPERLETQNMDVQSDLWSVAVLLYQMIANRLPFEEPTKERLERRIRSPHPPAPLPTSCPEPLRRIVFKMLARDPAKRYATPLEVSEDIARFQRGRAVLAGPPPAVGVFDSDATVRTTLPAQPTVVNDPTVRTPRVFPPAARTWRSHTLLGCLAAFLLIPLLVLSMYCLVQVNFWNAAEKLKADLQSERVTNLDQAWTQYQTLSKRSHLPVLLWGAERALRKRLVAAADETISEYRNSDTPAVFEPQWVQAHNNLARALELSPGDSGIQGRLRLCEGHICRFQANNARGSVRQKRLYAALSKFDEAATLLKHSPDPYLGLASLYDYQLDDVDKAEDALHKAAHYGHPTGKRETAQLADAYRRRAERMWRQSRGLIHEPEEERNFLDRAKQDYAHAEDLYQRAGLFGDAARNRLQAIHGEQHVEQRLSELQGSAASQ